MRNVLSAILLFVSLVADLFGQKTHDADLFRTLQLQDSLLFEVGYNHIDTAQVAKLLGEDIEMYHDQQGIITSKEVFLEAMQSLAALPFKARRELVKGSLQVFPLYEKGVLYGAIQMGAHTFFAKEEGKPEYITSTAKFTTLWIREGGSWKIKRALSYDHQAPGH